MPIARPSGPTASASASLTGSIRVAGIDLEIFSPRTVHQPCAKMHSGSGSCAAIRNADLAARRTQIAEVVRQRVEPHVDHVRVALFVLLGNRDSPRKARARHG